MTLAEQILVVILATFLAIFLLLGIGTLVLVNKLIKKLHLVADNAQAVTANIESASEAFRNAAGPMAASRILGSLYGAFKSAKKKR